MATTPPTPPIPATTTTAGAPNAPNAPDATGASSAPAAFPASVTPAPPTGPTTLRRHQVHRRAAHRAARGRGRAEVVVLGDSLTDLWTSARAGGVHWERAMAPLGAVAFGVGGDHAAHLLWRLRDGLLDGLRPRVVVLWIGSNMMGRGYTPDLRGRSYTPARVVDEIGVLVRTVQARCPAARVLVLGVLPEVPPPRGENVDAMRRAVNERLGAATLAWGVTYLDPSSHFDAGGGVPHSHLVTDGLHLSPAGYAELTRHVRPAVVALLGPDAPTPRRVPAALAWARASLRLWRWRAGDVLHLLRRHALGRARPG